VRICEQTNVQNEESRTAVVTDGSAYVQSWLRRRDRSRNTTRSLFVRLSIPFRTRVRGVDSDDKRGHRTRRKKVDPAARAAEWAAMIDGETIRTRADLARHLGVSRARVTQVLGRMPK